jgi:hypothetical protein
MTNSRERETAPAPSTSSPRRLRAPVRLPGKAAPASACGGVALGVNKSYGPRRPAPARSTTPSLQRLLAARIAASPAEALRLHHTQQRPCFANGNLIPAPRPRSRRRDRRAGEPLPRAGQQDAHRRGAPLLGRRARSSGSRLLRRTAPPLPSSSLPLPNTLALMVVYNVGGCVEGRAAVMDAGAVAAVSGILLSGAPRPRHRRPRLTVGYQRFGT